MHRNFKYHKFSNRKVQIPVPCLDMCRVEELSVLFFYLVTFNIAYVNLLH